MKRDVFLMLKLFYGVELFNVKLFLSGELTVGFSMNGDWTPPGFEFEF